MAKKSSVIKDAEKLEKVISRVKTNTAEIEKEVEPEAEPESDPEEKEFQELVSDEIEKEPEPEKTDPVIEKTEEIERPALSMFDDAKAATEEDKHITDNAIKQTVDAMAEEATDDDKLLDIDSAAADKLSNTIKAGIIVDLVDVGFMVVCLLITWDFSNDNQKKYTLNTERKKAIKINLARVYQLSGKKSNPKKDIIWLILGSYIPMLLIAVFSLIDKMKNKGKVAIEDKMKKYADDLEAANNKMRSMIVDQNKYITELHTILDGKATAKPAFAKPPEPLVKENIVTETIKNIQKKDGRGRHPKGCKCGNCVWSNGSKKKSKK